MSARQDNLLAVELEKYIEHGKSVTPIFFSCPNSTSLQLDEGRKLLKGESLEKTLKTLINYSEYQQQD